ncbi:MAG: hypothetical protein GQ542_11925 [Desulforhopalus sp.]|jgi:c-di-GMP-binding flagellar brake protein YcgR|nr:hypothetical protein [Desulforhopalus sp.]
MTDKDDFKSMLDGEELSNDHSYNEYPNTRRKSIRFRAKGIVVVSCFEESVVTNLYDIAAGGVSFLPTNEKDITESEFNMDILIFDGETDFEHFISQVKGRVKSKQLVTHSESNVLVWRFGAEFCNFDSVRQRMLEKYCSLVFGRC